MRIRRVFIREESNGSWELRTEVLGTGKLGFRSGCLGIKHPFEGGLRCWLV